ncbi:hypothetical protein C0075_23985 [Rhizobium sp. KAs_5_22]|nr:hypothetical protein C0075_23985 [Rhizobium sp. KAs_5_22]
MKTYKELSGNNLENTYLNVDSTNISTTSKAVEMAEYGYSKDGEYEPIVNISFITDQLNGLPIYYDIYAGSINDMSQCEILIDKSKELGIKNSCLVMDRGYFSSKNVQYLDKNGYKFIMMAKL